MPAISFNPAGNRTVTIRHALNAIVTVRAAVLNYSYRMFAPENRAPIGDPDEAAAPSSWGVRREAGTDRVVMELRGRLSLHDSFAASAALARELSAGPAAVLCDVRGLTHYEPMVHDIWRDALWPVRGNLSMITYLGDGELPRHEAEMLATTLEVPCEFVLE